MTRPVSDVTDTVVADVPLSEPRTAPSVTRTVTQLRGSPAPTALRRECGALYKRAMQLSRDVRAADVTQPWNDPHVKRAELELQRAALALAAAHLEASGEAGTLAAIVLLGQISESLS